MPENNSDIETIKLSNAERKRRANEERRKYLHKERLAREIAITRENGALHRRLWMKLMMTVERLIEKNVEICARTFERALQTKDDRIDNLLNELDEIEDQYRRNVKSHMEIIDKLLLSFETMVDENKRLFRRNLREALDSTSHRLAKIEFTRKRDESVLGTIASNVERNLEELLYETRSNAISKIDGFIGNNTAIVRSHVIEQSRQLETLSEELMSIIVKYQEDTLNYKKTYEMISKKDESERILATERSNRIVELSLNIDNLQKKINTYREKSKEEVFVIKSDKDSFLATHEDVKRKFAREQNIDKACLNHLSNEYELTLEFLTKILQQGERMLIMNHSCEKYETEFRQEYKFEYFEQYPSSMKLIDVSKELSMFWLRLGKMEYMLDLEEEKRKQYKMRDYWNERLKDYFLQQKLF